MPKPLNCTGSSGKAHFNGFDASTDGRKPAHGHAGTMPRPTFAALLLLTVSAAMVPGVLGATEPAAVIAYPTPQGVVVLSDAQGGLLELAPAAWGVKWAWTGFKTTITVGDGSPATRIALDAALGPEKAPLHLVLTVRRSAARELAVDVTASVERDCGCTMVALAVTPGAQYHGAGLGQVIASDGTTPRDVPFGRDPLGTAVTGLRLGTEAQHVALTLSTPTEIQADGAARLILAKDQLTAGTTYHLAVTIATPGDVTWFATPSAVPDPDGFAQWFPWHPSSDFTAQSEISMAGWSAIAAGDAGRVTRDGERLVVGGKPAKFWGIDVCYANCSPTKEIAERRARFYAKYGFNAVRLHKYADGPGWAGIQSADSFAEFDPAGLDRLDYQVAKFKEQGIRVKLSPTFGINLGNGDRAAVPYLEEFGKLDPKKSGGRVRAEHGAVWFSRELQDLQIRQTTNLLSHRNPYTGLTYAEDPAVLVVELYNEDSALFFGTMGQLQKRPTLRKRAAEAFSAWLSARYHDDAGLAAAWGPGAIDSFKAEGFSGESLAARSVVPAGNPWFYDPEQLTGSQAVKARRLQDTMLFLYETQNAFWERFSAALRAAGYHGEILGSNWIAGRGFSHLYNLSSDARLGIVDRHNYFSGPGSMLEKAGKGILSIGLCQVADRPFSLSEWVTTRPNEWLAEDPALIGAYGMGLQGWDVSFLFQNGDDGHFRDQVGKDEWDVLAPPLFALLPAVSRQVLRGDVSESPVVAPMRVNVAALHDGTLGFSDRSSAAGDVKAGETSAVPAAALAVARCAVEFTEKPQATPAFDLAPYRQDGALVSATKQLRWYEGDRPASGCFTIDTPATKAVVGFARDREFHLGDVSITVHTPFAALYLTASGRDDHDLASATHILVTAVARAYNSGMKMSDGKVLAPGAAPILMEPVRADIRLPAGQDFTVTALDHDGVPTATTVPVSAGAFTIDGATQRTVYWEITRR